MDGKITFEKDSVGVKNPRHLQRNVFLLFSSRQFKIEPASCRKIDTKVTASLPTNSKGFLTPKFREDKINELFHGKHSFWVEILNKSFEDPIEFKKGELLGFLVVESEDLKFQYVLKKKKAKKEKKSCILKMKKAGRSDFAYGGRDTVNQAAKVAPGEIKSAANDINNIAKQRIDQIIS